MIICYLVDLIVIVKTPEFLKLDRPCMCTATVYPSQVIPTNPTLSSFSIFALSVFKSSLFSSMQLKGFYLNYDLIYNETLFYKNNT